MVAAFSLPDQEEQLRLREHARSDVGWLQLRYKLAARRVPMLLHVANQSWMGQFALCTFGCTLGELSTWRFALWIALWNSFLHFGRGASAAGLGRGWRLGRFRGPSVEVARLSRHRTHAGPFRTPCILCAGRPLRSS